MSLELLQSLVTRVELDRATLARYDSAYRGTRSSTAVRANVARPVVDRLAERLSVVGFRPGPETAPDPSLWALWQSSGLDRASRVAHRTALIEGRCYALAWADRSGRPLVTIESPRQTFVHHDAASGQRLAAVKVWVDSPPDAMPGVPGTARAVLFTPETVQRWSAPGADVAAAGWVLESEEANALGSVPMVRLAVGGGLLNPDGESVLADVLPLSDGLDELTDGMVTTSRYYSEPRRWILGELPTDPDTGEVDTTAALDSTKGKTWWLEGAQSVGQFAAGDLAGYVAAITETLRLLGAVTGLAPSMLGLTPDSNPSSADAIRAAEASLACRARDAMVGLGEGWEEVVRLAVTVRDGVEPGDLDGLETVWADPETRTVAAQVDGVAKLVAVGVPLTVALSDVLGWTPAQVELVRTARRADALDTAGLNLTRAALEATT